MNFQVVTGQITEKRKEQLIASAQKYWDAYNSLSFSELLDSPYQCGIDWQMAGGNWRRLRPSSRFWIEGEKGEPSPRLVKVWAS